MARHLAYYNYGRGEHEKGRGGVVPFVRRGCAAGYRRIGGQAMKIDMEARVRQVTALYWAGMEFNDAVIQVREFMDQEQAR